MAYLCALGCGKTSEAHPTKPTPSPPHWTEPTPSRSNADTDPPFRSGTRLRARVWDDGDGTLSFIEWHDTKLDAACVFLPAEDGTVRCLPWARDDVIADSGRVIHTDPQCQNPALLVREGATVPQYSRDAGTLDTRCRKPDYAVYRVGTERIQPSSVFVWNRTNGECERGTAGLPAGTALYPLAEKVGPETFVAADQHPAENAGRLRAIEVHGEDGSFQRVGIWDSAREERCSYPRAGSVDRCLPDLAWLEQWFADADCTTSAISWGDALKKRLCPLPSVAAIHAPWGACGRASLQLFDLTSTPESGELFFVSDTRSCVSLGESQYYKAGQPVPLGTFGELVPVRVGHGRLKIAALTGPDGARLEPADGYARFIDELADSDCRLSTACDGTFLCKPGWSTVFADASCTTAALDAYAGDECSPNVPRLGTPSEGGATCWNGQLLDIGDPLEERRVYVDRGNGGCMPSGDLDPEHELRSATFSAVAPAPLLNHVE